MILPSKKTNLSFFQNFAFVCALYPGNIPPASDRPFRCSRPRQGFRSRAAGLAVLLIFWLFNSSVHPSPWFKFLHFFNSRRIAPSLAECDSTLVRSPWRNELGVGESWYHRRRL